MLRKAAIIMLTLLLFAGCSRKNEVRITGITGSHHGDQVTIKRVDVNVPVPVDSGRIRSNGSFRFRIKASEPEFYEIGVSKSDFITILAGPGEKVALRFKGKNFADGFTVAGSPGTSKLIMLDSALAVTRQKVQSLRASYDSAMADPSLRDKVPGINSKFNEVLKEQRMFNIGFILKNLRSFASIVALYQMIDQNTYVLYDTRDLQFLKLVSDTLNYLYPDSKQAKALKADFQIEYNQSKADMVNDLMNSLPATKLDPSLKDMSGKRIALSSLRGKYVLLSFWSASSSDCVAENLLLKELYKKYRNRGFEIYQVNVDIDINTWKKAVKFDELPWISVREDDPRKPSTAILFNAKVLPANYLYDRDGKIIGSNFHGRQLQLKLSQIFGN